MNNEEQLAFVSLPRLQYISHSRLATSTNQSHSFTRYQSLISPLSLWLPSRGLLREVQLDHLKDQADNPIEALQTKLLDMAGEEGQFSFATFFPSQYLNVAYCMLYDARDSIRRDR